jgi:hypothetical protein
VAAKQKLLGAAENDWGPQASDSRQQTNSSRSSRLTRNRPVISWRRCSARHNWRCILGGKQPISQPIVLAVHVRPALRTARRSIRRARGEAAFRAFGYKLSAPDQPGQTLVALAYVGKVRSPTPTSAVANPNARFACRLRSSAGMRKYRSFAEDLPNRSNRPVAAFPYRPMNGREALESGRRLKA